MKILLKNGGDNSPWSHTFRHPYIHIFKDFLPLTLLFDFLNLEFKNFLQKQALENQTAILNATVCQREKFIELIEAEIKLQLVEIPHWAGLGGVCYIPPEQRRSPDDQGNLLRGVDIWSFIDGTW